MTELFPDAAGEFLHNMLSPGSQPGPPWTHTIVPPEPEYDAEGNEIWREPDPAYTLTSEPGR